MMMPHSDLKQNLPPAVSAVIRRGSTLSGVLATIGIIGTFAAVVYVAAPSELHGSAGASVALKQPIDAANENNQLLIESLATLIGHSAEVVAVHLRTASPYMEIVLRMQGSMDSTDVAAEEIAVISHSSVLHTIMLHSFDNDDQSAMRRAERSKLSSRHSRAASNRFTRAELELPGFCDQWRSNPNVKPRLLARGISDMRVQTVDRANDQRVTLRLSLTWSPEFADGGDEAAVLIDAAMKTGSE
jgi:hypothetical protein